MMLDSRFGMESNRLMLFSPMVTKTVDTQICFYYYMDKIADDWLEPPIEVTFYWNTNVLIKVAVDKIVRFVRFHALIKMQMGKISM